MTKVRCLDCSQITLRNHPKMANEGFGQCKRNINSGQFVSYLYRRECSDFKRADEERILKLYAWQDQLKMFRRVGK